MRRKKTGIEKSVFAMDLKCPISVRLCAFYVSDTRRYWLVENVRVGPINL